MAADPNASPVRFKTIVWIHVLLSLFISSSWSKCEHGTYEHDGKLCCRCGVGMYVVKHCSDNEQPGICDVCKPETYSSEPNDQMHCEPCTSCLHPNDNLEEDLTCRPYRNSKCRCRKDHYCASDTDICKLCHPCDQCGTDGIKVPCTAHKNSVCNDFSAVGPQVGVLVCMILAILLVLIISAVAVVLFLRKRRMRQTSVHKKDEESVPIRVSEMDIQPLMPDIVKVLGWKDMQDVAIRDKITGTVIDSFKLSSPTDSQEQTLQLLRHFVERNGMKSGQMLINILHGAGKKDKAEKVGDILIKGSENQ